MSTDRPTIILALDAATPPATVAVVTDGEPIARAEGPFGRGTDAWIVEAARRSCAEAGVELGQLTAVVATAGPGTFTGIRVGLATAMGLGRGLGIPVGGVGTLEALAAGALHRHEGLEEILALVDARRGEIYAGLAGADGALRWGPELLTPEALRERKGNGVAVVGTGAAVAGLDPLPGLPVAVGAALRATALLAVGGAEALPAATPRYLRRPDATPGRNPLRARRRPSRS